RIAVHSFASRSVHFDIRRCGDIDAGFLRKRQQDFVLDDLRLQSRLAKLLRNVIRGGLIFRRSGHVRGLRQNAQVLPRQLWVRDGVEFAVKLGLSREIAKPKYLASRFSDGRLKLVAETGEQENGTNQRATHAKMKR